MAKVKTPAGVQHFKQGIGEEITPDGAADTSEPGSSAVRLSSLLLQINAAERTGNKGQANMLRAQFEKERIIFSKGKTAAEVVAALNAVLGT